MPKNSEFAPSVEFSLNKWTKISGLETNIFGLFRNDGEKWSKIFIFKFY